MAPLCTCELSLQGQSGAVPLQTVPSLGLGEAFPTDSSGQMPGRPCRARAELLPRAVTAHCYARSLCSASCKCVHTLPMAGQALLLWHGPTFWWGLEKTGLFSCFVPLVFKYLLQTGLVVSSQPAELSGCCSVKLLPQPGAV